MDGQVTKWGRNITENFNRLSRAHERCRRQTDDRRTGDSIQFKFAKIAVTPASLAITVFEEYA